MNNAMMIIDAKRTGETWVFDDDNFGLVSEPFILGASQIIDAGCELIGVPKENITLLFSANPFPNYHFELKAEKKDSGGCWYSVNGSKGWLCPATLHYFKDFPENIYVRFEKSEVEEVEEV